MPYPFDQIDEILEGAPGYRRLSIEDGEAGFDEGRDFRFVYSFDFSQNTTDAVKLVSAVDFVATLSSVSVVSGGVEYAIIEDGTDNGAFTTPVSVIGRNRMSTNTGGYTTAMTATTGGVISSGTEIPLAQSLTGSNQNSRSTSIASLSERRGYPAGTYYLKLTPLSGVNDNCTGLLRLEWEERP